jgi:hypothetical protein
MAGDRPRVTVTTRFLVTTKTESSEQIAKFVMLLAGADGPSTESPETAIPGTAGRLRVRRVSATEGIAEFEVLGLNPSGDVKPATPESFTVDMTTKPLISMVWGGFYLMMAGGLLAMIRRGKDAKRATAELVPAVA